MELQQQLALEFNLREVYASNIINLIDEGNTIPFIARYRKEMHGACDDQVLRDFADRLNYLRNLNKEKEKVEKVIREQEKWTDEIAKALEDALTLTEVEDIYRPYKPKRKTRATMAIAKGLEPLADIILAQDLTAPVEELAKDYISEEKGVKTVEEAIAGAKDIIAERISDDANLRKTLREIIEKKAQIKSSWVEEEDEKKTYENYVDGVLDKEEYLSYKAEYEKQDQDIREKIQQAEQEKDSFGEAEGAYENWIEKFIKYGTLSDVTREIVTELIDKIIVNGDMSIDIVFKYQSPYPVEKMAV